ncbi:TetR/AcrR family transcriptional regulator [Nocardia stercoris]|uniref:TetR/AcrR family transcriptional regulator n=1 Tax=Nocardia stercoris TaxID=2483361 RepID=UPI001F1593EC|nr:TetR/AcrR family transcriptional regulator [Nocardia stercoris]
MEAAITTTDEAPAGRRARNKARTRERLLDAAHDLLGTTGSASTVEEIAERADVSRATFFNYFPSKDDLLTALYDRHMAAFTHVVDSALRRDLTTTERILALFVDFATASEVNPGYIRAVTTEIERISNPSELFAARNRAFISQIRRIVEAGVPRGEIRDDYSPDFLAQMVAAIYMSTIRDWRHTPDHDFPATFHTAGRFAAESIAPR